jgi:ribonuclease P protein subunit RPR2
MMTVRGSLKPLNIKQIAQQRIDILFKQAETVGKTNSQQATKYVKTAQKVAMSARFPLPPKYKHRVCKHCNTLLITGFNCRTRTQQKRSPHIVVTCLNCGYHLRIPIKQKKEGTKNE